MPVQRTDTFGHEDRERIYEYVNQHGPVREDEIQREVMPHDRGGFRHHFTILRRNRLLRQNEDGTVEVELDVEGEQEQFSEDDLEFTVRPAQQRDISGIVGVIRQVTDEMSYTVAESVAQVIDNEDVLLQQNEIESRMFFVATVEDEVVGWVHLTHPELEKLSHTAELTVGVVEGYRGHGIGSHLLQRALEWAASKGYEKVYQSVPSTNETAIEWLESHGWDVEARREGHYKIDGEYVDEVMMSISIRD